MKKTKLKSGFRRWVRELYKKHPIEDENASNTPSSIAVESQADIIASTRNQSGVISTVSKEYAIKLLDPSKEFCIIGLTGKVRSGTSDVCKLLTELDFHKILPMPDSRNMLEDEDGEGTRECRIVEEDEEAREYRIIYRYLRDNWKPFIEVSVTAVIISYLLDIGSEAFKKIEEENAKKPPEDQINILISSVVDIFSDKHKKQFVDKKQVVDKKQFADRVTAQLEKVYRALHYEKNANIPSDDLNDKRDRWVKIIEEVKDAYVIFETWKSEIKPFIDKETQIESGDYNKIFVYCFGILPVLEEIIKEKLKDSDGYPFLFQDFGNSIRASGSIMQVLAKGTSPQEHNPDISAEHLFDLSKRINQFIKVLRAYGIMSIQEKTAQTLPKRKERNSVFIIINNFKNFFEAYYFKRRYAAFYLIAVSCEEAARKEKFKDTDKYGKMRLREELSLGKRVFRSANREIGFSINRDDINNQLNNTTQKFSDKEKEFLIDCYSNAILYKSYKNNLAPFILQDVISCIENSDIFVTRDYEAGDSNYDHQLIKQLARISTLILHPGLLVPTKIERCMQIAMTAKLNSGCLSRQVGAVVTDKEYNVLSLGWNDAPCNAEKCIRRNLFDIINKEDKRAYSKFELNNDEYRDYLETISKELTPRKTELKGLPMAFCFKDVYQDLIGQRDQIYTRALHGEERAIASCSSNAIKGGYLFTTSSPCELCAKRAKQAGIKKIYYIELYPGISRDHVIEIGPKHSRAEYHFFVGATGLAYIKLYTPLIPYKDELAALSFSPTDMYHNQKEKVKNN